MTSDPGRSYLLGRAVYKLTQNAISVANMVISTAPIAPLTGMQNITLRVGLAGVVRDAIAVGRWYERAKAGSKELPPKPLTKPAKTGKDRQAPAATGIAAPAAVAGENPRFDEDATTEPIETVARLLRQAGKLLPPKR